MKNKQVVITLSEADYRLLQQALCAAQIHPGCSESARKKLPTSAGIFIVT